MIIKKNETKNENKDKKNKKTFDLKKINKKKLIASLISTLIIGLSIYAIIYSTKKENITIDIVSQDIAYTYGPNSSTSSNLKVGQVIEIKIITENKLLTKCYSSNEEVIKFTSKNKAEAKSDGSAQIYCESKNQKSNMINVIVGD